MNVRIFWVHAMKCMCAQTRPRFILSSERVFGGMEFEPMLTPRENPLYRKMSPEEDRTRGAVDSEPKHYQLSYSGPLLKQMKVNILNLYLLNYLCPSLPVKHRLYMTPCHHALFWAALAIPDQLVPCCFSSASVSRIQLLWGQPLFLFPCGFRVRVWCIVLDAEGVSNPAPLPQQYLLGNWFLSHSLPILYWNKFFQAREIIAALLIASKTLMLACIWMFMDKFLSNFVWW